jgi:FtsZ-binding cell division protein ZapB
MPGNEAFEYLKADVARLEKLFVSSIDDIKTLIRSEIQELKEEQIKELKQTCKDMELRLRDMEQSHENWMKGAGMVGWAIKTAIALASAIGGAVGWEHLKH